MLKQGKYNLGPCDIRYSEDINATFYEALPFSDKKGGVQLDITPKFFKTRNDESLLWNQTTLDTIGVNVKFISQNVSEVFNALMMPYLSEVTPDSGLYRFVARGSRMDDKYIKLFIRPKDNTDDSQDIIIYNALNVSIKKFKYEIAGEEFNEYNFEAMRKDGLDIDFNFATGSTPTPTELAWVLSNSNDYIFNPSEIDFSSAKLQQDEGTKFSYVPRIYDDGGTKKIAIEKIDLVTFTSETLTPTNNIWTDFISNKILDFKATKNYIVITFDNLQKIVLYDIANNGIIIEDYSNQFTATTGIKTTRIALDINDNDVVWLCEYGNTNYYVEYAKLTLGSTIIYSNKNNVISDSYFWNNSRYKHCFFAKNSDRIYFGIRDNVDNARVNFQYVDVTTNILDDNFQINRFNVSQNGTIQFQHVKDIDSFFMMNLEALTYYSPAYGNLNSNIYGIGESYKNNPWIAYNGSVLITYNGATIYFFNLTPVEWDANAAKTPFINKSFTHSGTLINMFFDADENFYIETSGKIYKFAINSGAYDIESEITYNLLTNEQVFISYNQKTELDILGTYGEMYRTFTGYHQRNILNNTITNNDSYKNTVPVIKPLTFKTLDDSVNFLEEFIIGGNNIDLTLLKFRLSLDGGSTWQYINGGVWTTSTDKTESNTITEINQYIQSLDISTNKNLTWEANLSTNIAQDETPDFSVVNFELNRS